MSQFNPDDPRITAYVFGELDSDPKAKSEFETELKQSADLRAAVEEVRQTVGTLESAFEIESASSVQPTSRHSLDPVPTDRTRKSRRWWVLSAVAAAVVVAIGLANYPIHHIVAERDAKEVPLVSDGSLRETELARSIATSPSDQPAEDFGELVDLITETIAPSSWEDVGGEGSIQGYPSNLSLVVAGDGSETFSEPVEGEVASVDVDASRDVDDLFDFGDEVAEDHNPFSDLSGPISSPGQSSAEGIVAHPVDESTPGLIVASDGYKWSVPSGTAVAEPEGDQYDVALTTGTTMALPQLDSTRSKELAALNRTAYEMALELQLASPEASGSLTLAKRVESLKSEIAGLVEANEKELSDKGNGPGKGGDKFEPIVENAFLEVKSAPLSTFSIDVDTASYSKTRQFLMEANSLPRPDAVRIEELLNYFKYDYEEPETDDPFWANTEVAACPWQLKHRLVRIGLQGKTFPKEARPPTNLVFLLDVSGSMDEPNKLPLLRRSMKMLTEQLGENDRVAITVYAGAAGLVLDSTTADKQDEILGSLERLHAGGSTNGGDGIHLAYQTALDNFIKGGVNRVILCTDGDFNVGTTGTDELVRLAEEKAKTGVFLSVFGFGMGNHNDSMLEQISNKGNGNYGFIDNAREAKKSFVEQMTGTLVTIAKDVKIQVEFNPQAVSAYRLIGYENRMLAARDFNDDTKDAGEIGAGHTVTALYEVVPAGVSDTTEIPAVDDLKYQKKLVPSEDASSGELLTLKLRYKQPDGDTSKLLTFPVNDSDASYAQSSKDYRFAASVASFGMLLRDSKYKGNATFDSVLELAAEGSRDSDDPYRAEFIEMVKKAKSIANGE
ncbi:MAG: von Willebrand factor type A domain-containing protein [Planctomycetales bacterium]|nr:von Willebrand factor type A domain-containing protein [Planctomycetales bacterium]